MDDKDKPEDDGEDGIPMLHDIVFDPDLPTRAPSGANTRSADEASPIDDHGPDYDPDTIDLFKEAPEPPQEALRAEAERVIEDLVAEYSKEITDRLRTELTDQLSAILRDLAPDSNADES